MVKHILVTLSDEQYKCVQFLKNKMGSSDAEVLRNIFLSWLAEKAMIGCWEMDRGAEEFLKRWVDRREGQKQGEK
ncbi:MAG TPA: hypothetical protein EYH45_05255 [Candidatus Caldiarchaeum subterraneum]|uniref:CopG family transcriptional regulator n=1 Tax=Caldiarchaeum subterraneum TaxID=311458 RepID=A0A833EA66_CALS0|nr:hypothetical protein [Aigarchaeota archaeon]HIQ29954.1 hypothetical protein [Candidatus Caldarchaeum subterraneum]